MNTALRTIQRTASKTDVIASSAPILQSSRKPLLVFSWTAHPEVATDAEKANSALYGRMHLVSVQTVYCYCSVVLC